MPKTPRGRVFPDIVLAARTVRLAVGGFDFAGCIFTQSRQMLVACSIRACDSLKHKGSEGSTANPKLGRKGTGLTFLNRSISNLSNALTAVSKKCPISHD